MVGSDGSSRYDWYCLDCGKSYHEEAPARADQDSLTALLMNCAAVAA